MKVEKENLTKGKTIGPRESTQTEVDNLVDTVCRCIMVLFTEYVSFLKSEKKNVFYLTCYKIIHFSAELFLVMLKFRNRNQPQTKDISKGSKSYGYILILNKSCFP